MKKEMMQEKLNAKNPLVRIDDDGRMSARLRCIPMLCRRLMIALVALASVADMAFGAVQISNLKIQQRYPWNGLVDISFVLGSTRQENSIRIDAINLVDGKPINVSVLRDASGNLLNEPLCLAPGRHRLVWDAGTELGEAFKSDQVSVSVTAGRYYNLPLYQVIDLSGGPAAERFPVSSLGAIPEGGWTKEYKTSKLVLKLIQPGAVHLGPQRLNGYTDECDAIIAKPFYIGVFKVTRKQWELVMGGFEGLTPPHIAHGGSYYCCSLYTNMVSSTWLGGVGLDECPVAEVPPRMLRGFEYLTKWPDDKSVAENSFFGVLRRKTSLVGFDLPTEAQWEHAARAGTTENKNLPFAGKDDVPNSWGLYEMMDDIAELCVDGYFYSYTEQYGHRVVVDPIGLPASDNRNCRNYWVLALSEPGLSPGIGQRMCIRNDANSGGACPLSFRVGFFPSL